MQCQREKMQGWKRREVDRLRKPRILICIRCGVNPVPARKGKVGQRPHLCVNCAELSAQAYRATSSRRRSRRRGLKANKASRAAVRRAAREHLKHPPLCRCGRDYMVVDLEESHVCPAPIDPRLASG